MIRIASILLCLATASIAAADVITFNDLSFAGNPTSGAFENGANLAGSFQSGGATFTNLHGVDPTYGYEYWSGWSYSNIKDTTTAGFGNQYAAYAPGGGIGGSTYGIATAYSLSDAAVTLPTGQSPVSMYVTNTTYAALSMKNGDSFAKKFGGVSGNDADFFMLTITGLDANDNPTGFVNFYLADYRFADNSQDYIVSDWSKVDLTSLTPNTQKLAFGFTSSDNSKYGMNTPAYFAADNIETAAVPEPGSMCLVAAVVSVAGFRRVRRWMKGERGELSAASAE